MSFQQPLFLLALLAVPAAVGLYLLAERRRMRYAIRFTNVDLLAGLVAGRPWRRYVAPVLFLLALTALCVAVARPRANTLVPVDRATVILVVDASRSMEARDVKPSRLGAAERALQKFLDRVPKRVRVGLVVFAGEADVAAPPTTDHELVRQSLDEIGSFPGFGGTAIGDALKVAVDLGKPDVGPTKGTVTAFASFVAAAPAARHGPVAILFLSDGKQNRGVLDPLQGADLAKQAGIPVYTIALGTPNGTLTFGNGGFGNPPGFTPPGGGSNDFGRKVPVPPDPATLRAIAQRTGGEFFAARSADALQSAYAKLGSSLGRVPGKVEVTNRFLAAAAALLAAAVLCSLLWSPRLP